MSKDSAVSREEQIEAILSDYSKHKQEEALEKSDGPLKRHKAIKENYSYLNLL